MKCSTAGMVAMLALGASACGGEPQRTVTIGAEDLWQAFDADQAAAMKRFSGAALVVDGTIETISDAGGSHPTLWLRTPAGTAPAFLSEGPVPMAQREALARVHLRCARVDHVGAQPYLYDCALTG